MPTFTNQAQLSYNGVITNSNVARGEIVEVLAATKTALFGNYSAGEVVTYVINIVNSGTTPFTDLSIADDLGAYDYKSTAEDELTMYPLTYVTDSVQYYQNGVRQTAPTVSAAAGGIFSGISVPAGGNTTIIYQAKVNEFAPLNTGSTITNTATMTGPELSNPIEVQNNIQVRNEPYLTIFKSVSPRQVPENGQVTYTFEIQNLGNTATTAADNVQILDTFLPIISNITVYYNGAVLPSSDYTYGTLTGDFATNAGVINVPAATFTQNTATGAWTTVPGEATLVITGTI